MSKDDDARRYLRQLRELGETELVVSDGGLAKRSKGRRQSSAERASSEAKDAQKAEIQKSSAAGDPADWRAVLTAAGNEDRNRPAQAAPKRPGPGGDRYSLVAPVAGNDSASGASDSSAGSAATVPPGNASSAASLRGLTVSTSGSDIFTAAAALESLGAVEAAVASCTRCVLHKAAIKPVPGEGSTTAQLVCVGEGPGAAEDETGRPFVGAAGKLLTSILGAIKLKREDVYICNVVKHRPPGNRTPLPDEILACRPFLSRQLELLRPRVILALGAVAAQTLLDTRLSIGKLRGCVHRYNGTPLVVTYHPAALLRNPGWKRPTWDDVQLVRRILDGSVDG